jgi:hypothetical protein
MEALSLVPETRNANSIIYYLLHGARGSVVVKAIHPTELDPGIYSASNRNGFQKQRIYNSVSGE